MRFFSSVSIALAVLSVWPAVVHTQAVEPRRNTLVALDPLGIPWDVFQIELETRVGAGATIGAVGSFTDIDDKRNTTVDFKVRYYPSEELFNKLSTGLSLGYTRFSRLEYDASGVFGQDGASRATLGAPTIGVLVDYNWVHGSSRRFVVGTGVGAKRIIASADRRTRLDLGRAYMTGRFVIGIAF